MKPALNWEAGVSFNTGNKKQEKEPGHISQPVTPLTEKYINTYGQFEVLNSTSTGRLEEIHTDMGK